MADFVPEPRDRLEAPICKAIESKDFKQALKLVEKRLLKNEDPYLVALRCFILCNSHLVVDRGKALGIIMELSNSTEGPYSIEQLDLYDEGLRVLFPECHSIESRTICKMRADAVRSNPKDEKLALACFRACLKRDNLEYAQQIANILEKTFPSNRGYQFWSITMTALYAKAPDCPDQLAQVYSKLAYNKIRSIAALTIKVMRIGLFQVFKLADFIKDGNAPSSRTLQTPQELLLFYRLLSDYDDDPEGLRIVRHERLGPTSKIAKDEWVFRRKQIELLRRQGDWQALLDTTCDLLSNSRANNENGAILDARGADWFIWKEFLQASSELATKQAYFTAYKEVEAHIDQQSGLDKTYRRNADLAFLELRFIISRKEPFTGPFRFVHGIPVIKEALDGRAFALCRYLYQYGHNTSAFDDIKSYIVTLNIEDHRTFITALPHFLKHLVGTVYLGAEYRKDESRIQDRHQGSPEIRLPKTAPESPWNDIVSGITLSKISYFLKSCMAESARAKAFDRNGQSRLNCSWCKASCGIYCTSCLQNIALECLQNYCWAIDDDEGIGKKLKSTDQHPADEWAILAAMSLIKMAGCRPWVPNESHDASSRMNTQHLLRATLILEFAHTQSKPNPQILLLLTRHYSQLGAGSLAMRAYSRLGLKQVQGDTLGYTLFDRISSLHPHAVDGSSDAEDAGDPSKHLNKLQRLYRSFRNQIITNSWRSFEHGSYDSIFQLMDVSGRLSCSMTAAMSAIELRRIDRLTKSNTVPAPNSHGYDLLPPQPADANYSDNLDYCSFPNYEQPGEYPFEMYTRIAPGPSQIRIQAFLLLEELWMVVLSVSQSKTKQTAAQIRLGHLKNVILFVTRNVGQETMGYGALTTPERLLVQVGLLLINFLAIACDPDLSNAAKVLEEIAKLGQEFGELVYEFMRFIEDSIEKKDEPDDDWIPMFMTTTHPLYTAHEAATLTLAVSNYLCKTAIWVNNDVMDSVERCLTEFGKILRNVVSDKARMVMDWINGPRLDHVLAQIQLDRPQNGESHPEQTSAEEKDTFERENGYKKDLMPDVPEAFGSLLSDCVSPDFLESWASELVDSWRESIMGLACLKSDKNDSKVNLA